MKNYILSVLLLTTSFLFSQSTKDRADYNRAVDFLYENYSEKTYNLHIEPHWFEDEKGFWFKDENQSGTFYKQVIYKTGKVTDLFNQADLAKKLGVLLGKTIASGQLGIDALDYVNATEIILTIGDIKYKFNPSKGDLSKFVPVTKKVEKENVSPDGKWQAYTEDFNLFVKHVETGEKKQLSFDGTHDYAYGSWYEWDEIMVGENSKPSERFIVNWSPNSEWLEVDICDTRTAKKMYLLDWSIDSLYRPKLLSYFRGSPGDTAMVFQHPVFFNVKTGKELRPKLPKLTHINPLEFEWSEKSEKVILKYSSRGYQSVELFVFDLKLGAQTSIYKEASKTNIDNFESSFVEGLNRVYFLSERSGWKQMHYVDLASKKVVSITKGEFFIHEVLYHDEVEKVIYFIASGVQTGENPYYKKLYKVDEEGKKLTALTPEDRNHQISLSPKGNYFVDNISTAEHPTKTILRDTKTGKLILELETADVSKLTNFKGAKTFTALARDGKTTIYGALWLPSNFDETKKYPVIDHSYTGPHTQMFPTQFRYSISDQALAELGFIVMRIDGLGSSGRSKEFHDYSYKNLGGNLEDHVGALRQLAKQYNWIDTTRVGIYGHSAGGYDAGHALLAYPDFYKVAVTSSGDHDHRMEKAWWPEMYMGWPVDSAYHNQSNITMAGNLKGKLLIVHGGIDENVNPSASFKFAEALIKADKQFDLLILPSQRHGYTGIYSKYFLKTRWNYFVEHLLNEEPIWDIDWKVD
jgi:dipeptidyl-peptidase 4